MLVLFSISIDTANSKYCQKQSGILKKNKIVINPDFPPY